MPDGIPARFARAPMGTKARPLDVGRAQLVKPLRMAPRRPRAVSKPVRRGRVPLTNGDTGRCPRPLVVPGRRNNEDCQLNYGWTLLTRPVRERVELAGGLAYPHPGIRNAPMRLVYRRAP